MNTLHTVRHAPHNKTVGMEIECLVNREAYRSHRKDWTGMWYMGSDVSITRDHFDTTAVEFVSQPLTVEWMQREIKKLYKAWPSIEVNNSCGIHLHVSKKWLSDKKARAIYAFLQTLTPEQEADFFGRRGNSYCRTTRAYGDSRYNSINKSPEHTIEFRMFASSSDVRWPLYCLKCVQYMMENAYNLNVDAFCAFVDMEKPRLTLR